MPGNIKVKLFLRILFALSLTALYVLVFVAFWEIKSLRSLLEIQNINSSLVENSGGIDVCGEDCKAEIERVVSGAISTISANKTVIEKTNIVRQGSQTLYIPLGGTWTTTSTDWTDVKTSDFYLDLADYGNAKVSWDAFLKVAHGNGQAFARLYDVTHNIAVTGGELSVQNNSNYSQVSSGNLNLWSGRNLYRVQIKSLNSFEVFFDNGRVKIIYQ